VQEAAESIRVGLVSMACGSYRRGKSTCGDVDVLITHADGRSHRGIFKPLIARLHQTGDSHLLLLYSQKNSDGHKGRKKTH